MSDETDARLSGLEDPTIDIVSCARCGCDHFMLRLVRMDRPIDGFQYWADCPSNGNPILVKVSAR